MDARPFVGLTPERYVRPAQSALPISSPLFVARIRSRRRGRDQSQMEIRQRRRYVVELSIRGRRRHGGRCALSQSWHGEGILQHSVMGQTHRGPESNVAMNAGGVTSGDGRRDEKGKGWGWTREAEAAVRRSEDPGRRFRIAGGAKEVRSGPIPGLEALRETEGARPHSDLVGLSRGHPPPSRRITQLPLPPQCHFPPACLGWKGQCYTQ